MAHDPGRRRRRLARPDQLTNVDPVTGATSRTAVTDTVTARLRFTAGEWSYFEVAAGVMWVVHHAERVIRRYAHGTLEPTGEPVPGFGDEIIKVRSAAGRLWLPGAPTMCWCTVA